MTGGKKLVIDTEDGRFVLAQSEVPEYRGKWYLEATVNTEGSYTAATLEEADLLLIAAIVRSGVGE